MLLRESARSAAQGGNLAGKLSAGGIGQEIDRRRENYFMARQPSFSRAGAHLRAPASWQQKTKIAERRAPTLFNYAKARFNEEYLDYLMTFNLL